MRAAKLTDCRDWKLRDGDAPGKGVAILSPCQAGDFWLWVGQFFFFSCRWNLEQMGHVEGEKRLGLVVEEVNKIEIGPPWFKYSPT